MTTEKQRNGMETIRFFIYILALSIGAGATYGSLNSRLNALEDCVTNYKTDHELILMLNVKVDNLCETLKEVRADVKELRRR